MFQAPRAHGQRMAMATFQTERKILLQIDQIEMLDFVTGLNNML